MPLPNKKTFVFDIDETILSCDNNLSQIFGTTNQKKKLNDVEKTISEFSPYGKFQCWTLKKQEMSEIFRGILNNDDEIAVVTSGGLTKDKIKLFFTNEYGINLGDSFKHYNHIKNKIPILKDIKGEREASDIIFVDNSKKNINSARNEGFITVYADTNPKNKSNGKKYILTLQNIIKQRKNEIDHESKQTVSYNNLTIRTEIRNTNTYETISANDATTPPALWYQTIGKSLKDLFCCCGFDNNNQ
ncbi:hypothetical protein L3V82_13035 [Thiotrichales bacterium 19S3-7]|nr:hypothetical protein [Thiotrichales bacterium 19S3-7]MCF6803096.1 hypothetical protein [Thiotrichales bacterium 19S3-11]